MTDLSKAINYFKKAVYPVRAYQISIDLGISIQEAKSVIESLLSEGLIETSDGKQYGLYTAPEPAPAPVAVPEPVVVEKEPEQPVHVEVKPQAKRGRKPICADVRKKNRLERYKRNRREHRPFMLGESDGSVIKRPNKLIAPRDRILSDGDVVYFNLVSRHDLSEKSFTGISISDLEALLAQGRKAQRIFNKRKAA